MKFNKNFLQTLIIYKRKMLSINKIVHYSISSGYQFFQIRILNNNNFQIYLLANYNKQNLSKVAKIKIYK